MPVTGNLNQENTAVEHEERAFSVDNDHVIDDMKNVDSLKDSAMTVDSDHIAGTSLTFSVDLSESAQLSSSNDALSDFKSQATSPDEPTSQLSSASVTNSPNERKGFHDAFAAFASTSCGDLEEEESPMEVSNEVSQSTAVPEIVADTVGSSVVEPLVAFAVDSGQVSTSEEFKCAADTGYVHGLIPDSKECEELPKMMCSTDPNIDSQSSLETEQNEHSKLTVQPQFEETSQTETVATAGDSVYFIQSTDASGQVVTSIIDPNDIPSYVDSVVYKQSMKSDGEIETTIVYSGATGVGQEEQMSEQPENPGESDFQQGEQIIYAHDLSGQLTPIDPAQSANDVAPPGKQFVYMQDSTGRIIRTVMDANQTMVPGQQVYYTQSEDGRIITSVMDSAVSGVSEESNQEQQSTQSSDQSHQPHIGEDTAQQDEADVLVVDRTTGFNIDNSMSGLSMLAELSHLTAGQAPTPPGLVAEQRPASGTDSSSNSNDMDEFRPVAMVTKQMGSEDGVESVSSDIRELKVGQQESVIAKIISQMKDEQSQPSNTVSRDNLFVQWQNLDAMCWMDVVLVMLVYSPTLRPLVNLDPNHELATTLLITLLKANRQAQVLLQNLLKRNNGAVISEVQTGAGNQASMQDPKTSKLVCKENMDEIGKAINILYAMREKIWQALQPRLRCERGKHNSPVLVLPLLVREKPAMKQMFTMTYRYVFKCQQCSYSQDDRHTKILPSIPTVPEDFNMQEPCFVRNCFECQAPNQRMVMKFEHLEDFVQMHFVKGLPHSRFDELSFDFNGDHYEVTTVVHYKNNPDHFIAWVRNAPGNEWMECDDLKSVITHFVDVSPNIPPSQVHMVMWERRLTPQHTLVMRETEDTKLLASLVLTVQQPNAHQPTDSQETRQANLPGVAGMTSSSPTLATNLLSGLMAQNFTPFAARGSSRGSGNRGSLVGRGPAAAISMPVIRRVGPAITQVLSNPQTNTSPQIVRLNTPGGARYVLLGNSSQAGTATSSTLSRAGASSKVVVVRSQGGAANISPAQLLQLLQRSGAISQVGTRITTTMTTSGAANTGAAASTSYVIQQDGSFTTNSTSAAASQLYSTSEQIAEGTAQLFDVNPNKQNGNEQTQSISEAHPSFSTLLYPGATVATSEQASASNAAIQPSQPEIHPETSTEETTATSEESVTGQSSLSGQTVTVSQQPGRYIQVPNPSGDGMLLCQLSIRDGKIVLVPVDKNLQTNAVCSSLLKGSAALTSSPKVSICGTGNTSQLLSATSSTSSTIAQIQKQLAQTQNYSPGTSTGPRFITLPTSDNKRIQLISVPTGHTDQPVSKTAVMNNQQVDSGAPPREAASADGHFLSQSSNIVIHEVKRHEMDNISPTSLGTQNLDGIAGHFVSTPAVSLLKDVSARLTSNPRTSLLTSCLTDPQKSQESFSYILPGTNTTHILHTGPSGAQSGLAHTSKIFTTLSSSGTIVGGQLTPSPGSSTTATSPMDQDLVMGASGDNSRAPGILTAKRRLSKELNTTEYIPLGGNRSRSRGSQRGGRGRGARGRGRSQLRSADTELIAPPQESIRKISTLSDLQQIGAHVIEAGSEAIDGIPVVSIPDFSTESSQTQVFSEIGKSRVSHEVLDLAAAHSESGMQEVNQGNLHGTGSTSTKQQPRVIAQPIDSVQVNHGFDILTQGIMGPGNTLTQRPARSLLTGNITTLQSASSLLASLSETTSSSLASAASSVQAVARPQNTTSLDSGFGLNDTTSGSNNATNGQEFAHDSSYGENLSTQLNSEMDQGVSVMSIDENQVSAAERYRMPVELFQPDEESPEKSVKLDNHVNRMADSLSPRLYQNLRDPQHMDETTICLQKENEDSLNHAVIEPLAKKTFEKVMTSINDYHSTEVTMNICGDEQSVLENATLPTGAEATIKVIDESVCETSASQLLEEEEAQPVTCLTPKKVGRSRGRRKGSTRKRGGRQKLDSSSAAETVETVSECPSNSISVNETTDDASPERSSEISRERKETILSSTSINDLATEELMEAPGGIDRPNDNLKVGNAKDFQDVLEGIDQDSGLSSKKVGRPRGSTRQRGGRTKLSDIASTPQSDDTLVTNIVSAETSEAFSGKLSQETQSLEPSEITSSISLMEDHIETSVKIEVLNDGEHLRDELQKSIMDETHDTSVVEKVEIDDTSMAGTDKIHDKSVVEKVEIDHTSMVDTDEIHDTNVAVEKVGRSTRRGKVITSKQGGTRKAKVEVSNGGENLTDELQNSIVDEMGDTRMTDKVGADDTSVLVKVEIHDTSVISNDEIGDTSVAHRGEVVDTSVAHRGEVVDTSVKLKEVGRATRRGRVLTSKRGGTGVTELQDSIIDETSVTKKGEIDGTSVPHKVEIDDTSVLVKFEVDDTRVLGKKVGRSKRRGKVITSERGGTSKTELQNSVRDETCDTRVTDNVEIDDTSVAVKKVGRSKRGHNIITRERGGTKKACNSSLSEPVETVSPVPLDAKRSREMAGDILSGSLLEGANSEKPWSDKEAVQYGSITGFTNLIASNSESNRFSADGTYIEELDIRPKEVLPNDNSVDIPDSPQTDSVHDTIVAPKKTVRTRGKKSSIKNRGKSKSGGASASEHAENVDKCPLDSTSTVFTGSSPHRKAAELSSPGKESLQPSPSIRAACTVPEPDSIGGFLKDSLRASTDDVKPRKMFKSDNTIGVLQQSAEKTSVSVTGGLSVNMFMKSPPSCSAVVRRKRAAANWVSGSGSEGVSYPRALFSYNVVRGCVLPRTRHPSLGPVEESFTSPPPPPPPRKPRKRHQPSVSLSALVIRKRPKLQPLPNIILPKTSTGRPRSVKGSSNSTNTGDSVTCAGTLLERRAVTANWKCSVSQADVSEYFTGPDQKTDQRRYCKQLMTVLYLQAGDLSAAMGDLSDSYQQVDVTKDEEKLIPDSCQHVGVIKDEEKLISDSCQQVDATKDEGKLNSVDAKILVSDTHTCGVDETNNTSVKLKGKQKKRLKASVCSRAKRAKSVQDEGSNHLHGPSLALDSTKTPSLAAQSPVNDTDTRKPQTNLLHADNHTERTGTPAAALSPLPSQTRRSGRTPIPSKKILDALGDNPFLSSMIRRVGSDDMQAGCSSVDIPHKKTNIPAT